MIGKIISAVCILMVTVMPFAPTLHSSEVKIMTVPVAEQIYMITGEGGNIGLFIGTDGTFLIDDQFAPLTDQIVTAIKAAGGEFPRFLINTHYHGDHTGGNENLGQGGTLIFSHHNVRERLSTGTF
ncbi:MAG: MBL fold metallo-hydrolase, partial [Thermodesulfobacteriota bacterium]|nr:MBL fold metallo-hydrolase [Thermodesulfobacteriota bacterium]